jgi:hypothetical protein
MVVAYPLGASIPTGSVSEHIPVLPVMVDGCGLRAGRKMAAWLRLAGRTRACPELLEGQPSPHELFGWRSLAHSLIYQGFVLTSV